MRTVDALVVVLAAALTAAACGDDGDASSLRRRPAGEYDPARDPVADRPIPEGTEIGRPVVRRLTAVEYENTVRDVFALGDEWSGPGLGADRTTEHGFDNDVAMLEVDEGKADELVAAAESIADLVLTKEKLAIGACKTPDRECAVAVIDGIGRRLFRRALTSDERRRYEDVFEQVASRATPRDGVRWTLVALLSSPSFLYRTELGKSAGNGKVVLEGEEIAAELSYTFAGGPPDEALLERGRRGELTSEEARVAEARRLLATPRGRQVLDRFMKQWLRYDEVRTIAKDEAAAPGFASLRTDMAEETRMFLEDLLFAREGGVGDLFSARGTFLTPELARHYGLAGSGKVDRPEEQAIGILAQGSILSRYSLAQTSSPSQRGAFVRRKLLCLPLPPPPPNVGEPPVPQAGLTTRQLYEENHAAEAGCAGCHAMIDPIGFGLEHFDVAGRFRATEHDKPIDPSGHILGLESAASTFADHKGLAALLAGSSRVSDCVGGLMATYAFGTEHGKSYTLSSARDGLAANLPMLEFFAQIAAGPHFAVRWEK